MLRVLASFFLISSFNIYGEVLLSSPKISLNAQDQRVIEFKIQNETIEDNDIVLYEYMCIIRFIQPTNLQNKTSLNPNYITTLCKYKAYVL